jgi:hypothetical protein
MQLVRPVSATAIPKAMNLAKRGRGKRLFMGARGLAPCRNSLRMTAAAAA